MNHVAKTPVLIVGAGPTGLTLAIELAQRGIAHRIIDTAPGPRPGSRGKGLQPRTLEVFDDLGMVDQVLSAGHMAMPIRMTTRVIGEGGTVTKLLAPITFQGRSDIPYAASMIIAQWCVEEALRDRLAQLGGAVEFGTSLVSFDQAHDVVTAVLEVGDRSETVTVRWLVGADGGHSTVRKGTGIAFKGETREDVRMIVADVPVDNLDRTVWHMWRSATGPVMLCPIPSTDLFQFQAPLLPGQDPSLDLANLQTALDSRIGPSVVSLGKPKWASLWRANVRLADRYRAGRVLLAGDAAHIHSPAGGQGMNTGIQDAHNLGWKLAAVEQGVPEQLIDTYEEERRPVAEHVLALSNERLRETIDHGRISATGNADTMQLTIGYRGSTLAVDDRSIDEDATLARAGDRYGDVPALGTVSGDQRLFDLTRGGGWTLLRFGDADDVEHIGPICSLQVVRCSDTSANNEIVDPDGRLAAAFAVADGALVLLRPDGFIGALSDRGDVDAIRDYLAHVSPDLSTKLDQPR